MHILDIPKRLKILNMLNISHLVSIDFAILHVFMQTMYEFVLKQMIADKYLSINQARIA